MCHLQTQAWVRVAVIQTRCSMGNGHTLMRCIKTFAMDRKHCLNFRDTHTHERAQHKGANYLLQKIDLAGSFCCTLWFQTKKAINAMVYNSTKECWTTEINFKTASATHQKCFDVGKVASKLITSASIALFFFQAKWLPPVVLSVLELFSVM